ncbi:TPA: hypothetical protein ACKJYW_002242, partial [Neisseria gonorrhoeae]
ISVAKMQISKANYNTMFSNKKNKQISFACQSRYAHSPYRAGRSLFFRAGTFIVSNKESPKTSAVNAKLSGSEGPARLNFLTKKGIQQ